MLTSIDNPQAEAANRHAANRHAAGRARAPLRYVAILCICSAALASAIGYTSSNGLDALFAEDQVVEWATVGLFFATLAIAGCAIAAGRKEKPLTFWVMVLLLSALGIAAETSFGARAWGFSMPDMPGGGELDGPQDLVILLKRAAVEVLSVSDNLLLALVLLCFLGLSATALAFRASLLHYVPDRGSALFALSILMLAVAVVLDTFESSASLYAEEILELAAAACLLASVCAAFRPPRRLPERA